MFERHDDVGTVEEALICLRLGHTRLSLETQEVVKGCRLIAHCQKSISVTILASTAWRVGGHHSTGRNVAWKVGGLDCWDMLARG